MSDETLDAIVEQRAKGWPDFHPEDYCHRCGRPNATWFVASPLWNAAQIEQGTPSGIVCPVCFVAALERETGATLAWELRADPCTIHHLPEHLRDDERRWRTWYESTHPRTIASGNDCPSTGASIERLPMGDDGLYQHFRIPCPTCGLVLRLSSGRMKIPRHRERESR